MKGAIFVGGETRTSDTYFQATDPSTGSPIDRDFPEASSGDVDKACQLADAAFQDYSSSPPERIAKFLETIADKILNLGDDLISDAMRETGLPQGRLEGERGRTMGQLRMFAALVRKGEWMDARIDPAMPGREPMPRADLRARKIGLGPVAVFGASNFPLAFSVAGGDTAAALAAGCPVVVKGHPAHPATGQAVASAIRSAVEACDLPEGVFSYLPGASHQLGEALVAHPLIKAVGFTGSRQGGLALMKLAAQRPEPIPVYAEMSSVNPVVLMPAKLARTPDTLATGFVGSLTLGAGQFCTNPGLVFAIDAPEVDSFAQHVTQALEENAAQTMLTPGIHKAYCAGIEALEANDNARLIARGLAGEGPNMGQAALFETSGEAFLSDETLAKEVFGSASLLVRCKDADELARALGALEGQLTATLHLDEADEALAADLVPILMRKAGRILANGWPTGVEVTHAMVHGGPFPATSDGRGTSVGTMAIERFLRPVCFQDLPESLLPVALRPGNPLGVPQRIDGEIKA